MLRCSLCKLHSMPSASFNCAFEVLLRAGSKPSNERHRKVNNKGNIHALVAATLPTVPTASESIKEMADRYFYVSTVVHMDYSITGSSLQDF